MELLWGLLDNAAVLFHPVYAKHIPLTTLLELVGLSSGDILGESKCRNPRMWKPWNKIKRSLLTIKRMGDASLVPLEKCTLIIPAQKRAASRLQNGWRDWAISEAGLHESRRMDPCQI